MRVTLKNHLPEIVREIPDHVDTAVHAAAEIVEVAAKERVPVDSGALRDAIHTNRRGPGEYAVVAGDNEAFYGHMVEHGTTRTPPRPFLVPALESSKDEMEHLISGALRRL